MFIKKVIVAVCFGGTIISLFVVISLFIYLAYIVFVGINGVFEEQFKFIEASVAAVLFLLLILPFFYVACHFSIKWYKQENADDAKLYSTQLSVEESAKEVNVKESFVQKETESQANYRYSNYVGVEENGIIPEYDVSIQEDIVLDISLRESRNRRKKALGLSTENSNIVITQMQISDDSRFLPKFNYR